MARMKEKSVRLSQEQARSLEHHAREMDVSQSEVLRMSIDLMWENYGRDAKRRAP